MRTEVMSLARGAIASALSICGSSPVLADDYDLAIHYLGEHPADAAPVFADDIQGIAQDGARWFITQTEDLWRFPIGMDWDDVDDGVTGVRHTELASYQVGAPFVSSAFDHMGDLEHQDACGLGLLLIPLHGDSDHRSAILVVRADNLAPIGWQTFGGGSARDLCGWLAVDPAGDVYIGGLGVGRLERRRLNCSLLASSIVQFDLIEEIDLTFEGGSGFNRSNKQGGCFSPDGSLFVLGTGYEVGGSETLDGLHVFDTTTWQRIVHSTNGGGLFSFAFDLDDSEEPEGMTWIDLDGSALPPGMWGQLHVLLLNNDWPDSDNIWFKHYTNRIHVWGDWQFSGSGTVLDPYPTVTQALNLAWDGCEVRIRAGAYPETFTTSVRMRIVAVNGTVRIGD